MKPANKQDAADVLKKMSTGVDAINEQMDLYAGMLEEELGKKKQKEVKKGMDMVIKIKEDQQNG